VCRTARIGRSGNSTIKHLLIKSDIGKLRQVLINLLDNAVKYTREGGVTLCARTLPIADDPSRVALQLEIEDSGPGIGPEQVEQIFEPFAQAQRTRSSLRGTGLGLAISKSFVELLGGGMSAESEVGKGSLFRVDLPVALAEGGDGGGIAAARAAVLGLAPGQPGWRILVVDDSTDNRHLLSSLLREAGFEIREAENGEEAVELFQAWQPHPIWMDMRMPVLDGYEATKKTRSLAGGEAVKIVAVTASAFKEQHESILEAGCDEVVHKPFRDHEIFESMAQLLDIQYLYEDTGEEATQKEEINLSSEMLTELPPELLQDLDETTLLLNEKAILEVIGRIEEYAPNTAACLRVLVQKYEIERIRELLREEQGKDG
jgi:CheY-like chemotaxis protein/anti-sigma regulatory factor (Ser/Thr protein kinase)